MPSPTEITVPQLARLIGTPSVRLLIDVRIPDDIAEIPVLIPGSIRRSHETVDEWVDEPAGEPVVVICHKGRKLSQGVAALLRTRGIAAETLQGGMVGWMSAAMPTVRLASLPIIPESAGSLWVTRARPKIDRIACPWLIRRFIDRNARFLFVAASEVRDVADRFDAIPFDIEGCAFTHRGAGCSFDTILEEFDLHSDPLAHLAEIVRAADTNHLDQAPQAAGLLAASLGFSRMYRDDLQLLEATLPLYDALYRWCRDATLETHDWPLSSEGAAA